MTKNTQNRKKQTLQILSEQTIMPKTTRTIQIDKSEIIKLLNKLPPLVDTETLENGNQC